MGWNRMHHEQVGDSYMDQLDYSGHYMRETDADIIAGLGISRIRYPVLWEKHQPQRPDQKIDWTTTEHKLLQFKALGVDLIAGLVHHGSGPAYVHMLDDSFANGLADYAERVAKKFPWITHYTPVNEPLTTARFCGLYGLWYPHGRTDRTFVRVLVNECKATILAMERIRRINPAAKLVQTEDLGKVHSTPLLRYQASFENKRRWLSFDLLCGRVTPSHPLYRYLLKHGISADELQFFTLNACPPDIFGFNYYPTSELYLDENRKNYPGNTHGSNGRHRYADVEVVRVGNAQATGLYGLLKEAWQRYGKPLAVTEIHMHCTREEQLRWLNSAWNAVNALQQEQVDVRALTAWALLGSFGWNKLLTQPNGDYEPGVFDVLSGQPRSTSLAALVKSFAGKDKFHHPLIAGEGWWERDIRVIYNRQNKPAPTFMAPSRKPLLILGGGILGEAFTRACLIRNIPFRQMGRQELNILDPHKMEDVIRQVKPWAIINATGYSEVDKAEAACEACYRLNTQGPVNLASISGGCGIKLVTFSSDQVFNGEKRDPYLEHDRVDPLNTFGQSKALAEQYVLDNDASALVIRSGALFSPWDHKNYVISVLNRLKNHLPVMAEDDVFVSPTYAPDLVHIALNLLIDGESGIWHLANNGAVSWASFAEELARRGGYSKSLINPVPLDAMQYRAARPKFSALESEHGVLLPSLAHSLGSLFQELKLIA